MGLSSRRRSPPGSPPDIRLRQQKGKHARRASTPNQAEDYSVVHLSRPSRPARTKPAPHDEPPLRVAVPGTNIVHFPTIGWTVEGFAPIVTVEAPRPEPALEITLLRKRGKVDQANQPWSRRQAAFRRLCLHHGQGAGLAGETGQSPRSRRSLRAHGLLDAIALGALRADLADSVAVVTKPKLNGAAPGIISRT